MDEEKIKSLVNFGRQMFGLSDEQCVELTQMMKEVEQDNNKSAEELIEDDNTKLPHQVGWLCRSDLEMDDKDYQVWEKPNGTIHRFPGRLETGGFDEI